ncbi:16S rRNA (guanine(966)-N(2))-methyltransferase RsmD [Roseomonas alkaliterrae]|uniref:16S rRNA (Guanine966-N2)-methyltransferase n=1 Tax=Neoroseomonas alkaliterrae TaxID=1452450 RepID=A0A840XVW0_9PROT|nr:16S rRNA (guanine966-N2)-methyltransferase [Neoroseomonas alkaliterrae]MBR0678652.1 16S rRNA (guanine(966)-N(2))-methyltransferase RsmD [Neoroseomonas alkaliterrae]
MRIIAGRHRGRTLRAPEGAATRPTADRVRQALFDMLWHAAWGGRMAVQDQLVLDAFAGTGALGLEALSRGADHCTFIEKDRTALAALRANITACGEDARSAVLAADATRPPAARVPCGLVFLDPPYGKGLVPRAVAALEAAGWIAPGALLIAETGAAEALDLPGWERLASRSHGAACLHVLRKPETG